MKSEMLGVGLLHAFTMHDEWANLCVREGWSFPYNNKLPVHNELEHDVCNHFFGSHVTPGKCPLHCDFLFANLLTCESKKIFLFKMPIQPLRLVLQQKQPHQQLHLNKVSFNLNCLKDMSLKGWDWCKKILYARTSFVSFKYTPELWLELQCSVYWVLSDLCHQLDLKNTPRKNVSSSEWRGSKLTGLCGSEHYFYAWNVEIFQWSFCDEQLRQINQIPSIEWQSKDILLLYITVGNPDVGV